MTKKEDKKSTPSPRPNPTAPPRTPSTRTPPPTHPPWYCHSWIDLVDRVTKLLIVKGNSAHVYRIKVNKSKKVDCLWDTVVRELMFKKKNGLIFLKYNAAVLKVIYWTIAFWKQVSEIFGEVIEIWAFKLHHTKLWKLSQDNIFPINTIPEP